jgi:hypothetical protein
MGDVFGATAACMDALKRLSPQERVGVVTHLASMCNYSIERRPAAEDVTCPTERTILHILQHKGSMKKSEIASTLGRRMMEVEPHINRLRKSGHVVMTGHRSQARYELAPSQSRQDLK